MTKVFKYISAAALAVVLLIISLWGGGVANAATSATSVLDDLQKDESFNVADYPRIPNDYSLKVIQVAEGEQGGLYIYVYTAWTYTEPLTAVSVNISKTDNAEDIRNYKLTLLSEEGVFSKYRVDGFVLDNVQIRTYNVISIFRNYYAEIDENLSTEPNNTTAAKVFEVGQRWQAQTKDGEILYDMTETTIETIKITSPYVNYIRYEAWQSPAWVNILFGKLGSDDFVEAWFFAFDTDKPIDQLKKATIEITTEKIVKLPSGASMGTPTEADEKTELKLLEADEKTFITLPNDIWGNKKTYVWEQIQSVTKFKADNEVSGEFAEKLSEKKWILRFYESLFDFNEGLGNGLVKLATGRTVKYATILSLEFQTAGKTYKVGAIDDVHAVDQDSPPDKVVSATGFDLFQWLAEKLGVPVWAAKAIFWCIIALIVCAIALPILSAVSPVVRDILEKIFSVIWTCIKYFFIGIGFIIASPFLFIRWLIKKIRGD